MKRSLALVTALAALPSGASAQECSPDLTSIGWTQPNNLDILNEGSERWPIDASIRIAFGGPWMPLDAHFRLEKFKNDEILGDVPAQIRFNTPYNLVENSPEPLTIVEIDPVADLEPRSDYRLTVFPTDPALPLFAEYVLEFRTSGAALGELPDFAGIKNVVLDGDRCVLDSGPYLALDDTNPSCIISTRLRLLLTFDPIDRSDVAYLVYRTKTHLIDEAGAPVDADGNDIDPNAGQEELPLAYVKGLADTLGGGVPTLNVPIYVLYGPQPRRDCFSIRLIDEWGRERGDVGNEACIDIKPLAPCPTGCMGDQCQFGFPEPNPFETNDPIPGTEHDNIGLNGADPNAPIPPVGEEPMEGSDGGVGDGGTADGGAGGESGGGGGGGCSQSGGDHTDLGLGLGLLALLGLRRRRPR